MLEASKIEAAILTVERALFKKKKREFFYKFKEFLAIKSL